MSKLSFNEQIVILTDFVNKESVRLKNLPKEEARKEARKNLYQAGIVDEYGNLTEPYIALKS